MTQKTFQYDKLVDVKSMRLLTILPDRVNEPVRCLCSTLTVNNPSQTPFEAVSYVWGDDTKCCNIEVDGAQLAITKNANAVLKAMRHEHTRRTVWIDAICIDQSNVKEKNQQVPLMGDIYSKASSVFAWLGESADDSGLAMSLLKNLQLLYIQYHDDFEGEVPPHAPGPPHGISLEDLCRYTETTMESREWAALRALLKRPWFRRIWVYQEAVKAKEVKLVCGKDLIGFQDFAPIIHWLMYCPAFEILHYRDDPEDRRLVRPVKTGLTNLDRMHETRYKTKYENYTLDLEEHLCEPVYWEAKNPRDFVYGVTAMIEEAALNYLKPNYQNSTADVFIAATKWVITSKKSLRIISTTTKWLKLDPNVAVRGLPSWVPDLSAGQSRSPMAIGAAGDSSLDEDCQRDFNVRFDGVKLITQGYKIGRINGVGSPFENSNDDQKALHIGLADWIDKSVSALKPVNTDSLWNTLIRGELNEGDLANVGPSYHAGYDNWRTIVKTLRSRWFKYRHPRSFLKIYHPVYLAQGMAYARTMQVLSASHSLAKISVFDEATSQTLALVPQGAAVGDVVCVLSGSSVPMLLRPSQKADELYVVGGCYVDRINSFVRDLTLGTLPKIREEEMSLS